MGHRLLHTLVFASTSLLACGGTIDEIPDDAEAPPDAKPDAKSGKDAGLLDAAPDAPPDVAPPEDAGSDARTCEGGWPTTKGQICTFDAGIVCCQRGWDDDAGPICCEQGP